MVAPIKKPAAVFTTALLALARVAKSDSLTFVNQDSIDRTVVFTPNAGLAPIADLVVPGSQTVSKTLPAGWVGNAYAVQKGGDRNVPGILAEVNFAGWEGNVFFDASAIVNAQPNIDSGVKTMFPSNSKSPVSGCQTYKTTCNNAYNLPDDLQTKSTTERDVTVLLGDASAAPAPQPATSSAPATQPAAPAPNATPKYVKHPHARPVQVDADGRLVLGAPQHR